jgi:hypothetical protein
LGKLGSTGDVQLQVAAGKHRIQLRRPDFEEGPVSELDFTAGTTKSLSGPQVTLRPYGWIDFNVLPANSRITYSPFGGTIAPVSAKNGDGPRVKAGRYSITVVNSDTQQTYTENVEVEPGRGQAFNKTSWPPLQPKELPSGPITFGGEILETKPTGWLSREQKPGTYSFRIRLHGLRKRAKWVVNFVDNRNYIEYEVDEKTLKYTVHQNGSEQSGKSIPHGSNADSYDVTVDVGTNAITVFFGGRRIPIDTPTSNENLLLGKFGFPQGENWENFQFTTTAK